MEFMRFRLQKVLIHLYSLTLSLILLIALDSLSLPLVIAGIPLVLSEIIQLWHAIANLEISMNNNRKECLGELLEVGGSFMYKSFQIMYWSLFPQHFLITLVPLIFSSVLGLLITKDNRDPCQAMFNSVYCLVNWLKLITLLCVGLKLDGMVDWDWPSALWSVWVGLGFTLIVSLGIFVLLVVTYLFLEHSSEEIIILLLLFVAGAGSSTTVAYFSYALVGNSSILEASLPLLVVLAFWLVILTAFPQYIVKLAMLFANGAIVPEYLLKVSGNFYKESKPGNPQPGAKKESGMCEICFSNKADTVFMNCMHGGLCFPCAEIIRVQKGKCPICRSRIVQVLEIEEQSQGVFRVKNSSIANSDVS